MDYYIEILLNIENELSKFKEDITSKLRIGSRMTPSMFRALMCWTPLYQSYLRPLRGLIQVIEVFGIEHLEKNKNTLLVNINNLEDPKIVERRGEFERQIDSIKSFFLDEEAIRIVKDKLSILKKDEIERLDEAIHCFLQDCNYSSIIMSVSAIEFRLLSLMSSICPDDKDKLERLTLGALINEYLDNKGKYKNVIPRKYEPLLNYCNVYRIFSVHPKKERISRLAATSILYMAFEFLLDRYITA